MTVNQSTLVGHNIRTYRKARNLTQEELGEILEMDQTYVGRVERGEINITIDTLLRIANALHVQPEMLLRHKKNTLDKEKSEMLNKIDMILLSLNADELQIVQLYTFYLMQLPI